MNQLKTTHSILCVIPGLEEYAVSPHTQNKERKSKRRRKHSRDLYNLRLLEGLTAADANGFPKLKPWTPQFVSKPMAFHEARCYYRKHRTLRDTSFIFSLMTKSSIVFESVRRNILQ